jgi:hypothetical protein
VFIRAKTDGAEIRVAIPLTATSGKTRVKQRKMLNDYGMPVATCQTPLTQSCYVEWQMGYDTVIDDSEKLRLTSLPGMRFSGANGKTKALYELSEYVFWLAKWKLVGKAELEKLAATLGDIPGESLFDAHPDLAIKRSHLIEKEFNGMPFLATRVEYPLIIHKFGNYEIVAEIITREKQRAVGVQPMLYLCFPITELAPAPARPPLLGRTAYSKEHADFVINRQNAPVFVQLLHLFGMLSENHRRDILSIITLITANL